MQDEPTPTELIKAVADFLRNEIAPVRSRATTPSSSASASTRSIS